ncbi:MAG TPA: CAP domain-containing protein [Candidatus Limnocylindria bacterium]|nr:CAP domain-containing protein [Candidatus Limnocylindria bacterium]
MRRASTAFTLLPYALVLILAVGLGIAGRLSTHDSVPVGAATPTPSAAAQSTTSEPPSPSPNVSTPLASPSASPTASATPRVNDAAEMLRVHNELRAAVAAPTVRGDDRVTTAAQRHAEYLAQNNALGHDEVPGSPGFTGASVRDRLAAQGYTDANASEVATSFSSGTEGVRSLWVLPYHRLGLMHPHAIVAGWGHAQTAGRAVTVGVIVYDFNATAPERVRAPAPDQRVAGTYSGEEIPEVVPAGAARPVGYPIMVVYSGARAVDLRSARVTDASGRELPHHVVPQLYERDYVAIIPASPLAPGARYRVRLELIVAANDVVDEWEFEAER